MAHTVPLTAEMVALLEGLPRFDGGDYVFSHTFGKKPITGYTKIKERLDKLMFAELRAAGGKLEAFVLQDVRRSMRTAHSALPGVPDLVRELVIAHTRPGLHKVYDLHAYEAEKRHALEQWGARLHDIVTPAPANVVKLAKARA